MLLAMFFHLKNHSGTGNFDEEYAHLLLCLTTMRKFFVFSKG